MASAFSDPLAPSPCEQCGNANEGTMRCSVRDNKNLCQDCFQGLPQARREDIGDPEWVCNIHLNRKVDTFCETCELGCCRECAVDVHQGHNYVVNVLKLVEEIRRDLTKQLQEVGVRAEGLSELRPKIESSLHKIEEAPKLLDQFVDEIKHEIAQNLEKEMHRNQWETQFNMIYQERSTDNMLELAIEKAELDYQRIQEIKCGISTLLQEDAEKRRSKIQKAESKLLVGQQACKSANLQIKSMLESTPEKLVCEGRQLCSLVKASSAFQCQEDILESCREVEADLPKLKMDKDNFFHCFRPLSPFWKIVLCISLVFFYAYTAGDGYIQEYNRLLSFELKSFFSLILLYSNSTLPVYHAISTCFCFMFTFFLGVRVYDGQITRTRSFMWKLKSFYEIFRLSFEFGVLTVLLLILGSFPLHLFQVKSVSANIVYILPFLHSFVFPNEMRHSKTFKTIVII